VMQGWRTSRLRPSPAKRHREPWFHVRLVYQGRGSQDGTSTKWGIGVRFHLSVLFWFPLVASIGISTALFCSAATLRPGPTRGTITRSVPYGRRGSVASRGRARAAAGDKSGTFVVCSSLHNHLEDGSASNMWGAYCSDFQPDRSMPNIPGQCGECGSPLYWFARNRSSWCESM
jgi:hypothetical protein